MEVHSLKFLYWPYWGAIVTEGNHIHGAHIANTLTRPQAEDSPYRGKLEDGFLDLLTQSLHCGLTMQANHTKVSQPSLTM